MKMRNFFFIIFILIITGCEEVIELDLPENNPRIIVDALITDKYGPYTVKLSHSQKYSFKYEQDTSVFETGAVVIIHEDSGISDTLTETEKGTYISHPELLTGKTGHSYQLEIVTSAGKRYISDTETMLDVPAINSIYYERDLADRDPGNPNYYRFNVFIDWQDPGPERNYYLRKFSYYWSGVWHDNIHWNWVFNDKYFNGMYLTLDQIVSDYGGTGFKIRVEQFSLTKSAYDFWILIHRQTQEADDLVVNSSTPVIGNIYNASDPNDYALGYFQVSSVKSAEVWIN